MTNVNKKYIVPLKLDDQEKFLWWDFDVAIVGMFVMMAGILMNQTISFLVLGILSAFYLQKLKAGKSKSFLIHLLYWFLPWTFGMKQTPASSVREFIG